MLEADSERSKFCDNKPRQREHKGEHSRGYLRSVFGEEIEVKGWKQRKEMEGLYMR